MQLRKEREGGKYRVIACVRSSSGKATTIGRESKFCSSNEPAANGRKSKFAKRNTSKDSQADNEQTRKLYQEA
eukprot:8884032-Ditylum_brightwellii.AAC.1